MTKEEFKAKVSMAYHGFYPDREEWERFLEDMWQLHLQAASHWISVEDELPSIIDIVLYCDEDGNYYTEIDNIGQDVKITHWMRIPDCPPLQDFCNKLRAFLGGENEKGGEQ